MTDEQHGADPVAVAQVFVDLAATLVGPYAVPDLAQRLVDGCVEVLDVWAAGLLLADPGSTPKVLAASTHQAELLELVQVRSGQGPCLEAMRRDELVVVDDVPARQEDWPDWVAGAQALGIDRAYGIPLHHEGETIGALNLFRRDAGPLGAGGLAVARSLADMATLAILQHRAMDEATTVTVQLQRALDSRVVIEQAKGVLAEREGVSVGDAFARLRAQARAGSRPISAVAHDVVAGAAAPSTSAGADGA